MANSGIRKSVDLKAVVLDCLSRNCPAGTRIGIALSGGMDSVTLLDTLLGTGYAGPEELLAIHVNHGLSAQAADWERFCRQFCADRGVRFVAQRVRVQLSDGLGLEGAARKARYEALCSQPVDVLLLGHHLDDQAETVLLQLLRSSGVNGLAAMPEVRRHVAGPLLIRPFLGVARASIERQARQRGLHWVEDGSNLDDSIRRNFLRLHVFPALEGSFPGAKESLASAAANLADARLLLDEMAKIDLENLAHGGTLQVSGLIALGSRRARNAFIYWLSERGAVIPSRHAIDEALRQLKGARCGYGFRMQCGRDFVCRYRDQLHLVRGAVEPNAAEISPPWQVTWSGEERLILPGHRGILHFSLGRSGGISLVRLAGNALVVRGRTGGERLSINAYRPRRAIKKLMQEQGIPWWVREQLPFLWIDRELVAVPGLGVSPDWQSQGDEPGWKVTWVPTSVEHNARLLRTD